MIFVSGIIGIIQNNKWSANEIRVNFRPNYVTFFARKISFFYFLFLFIYLLLFIYYFLRGGGATAPNPSALTRPCASAMVFLLMSMLPLNYNRTAITCPKPLVICAFQLVGGVQLLVYITYWHNHSTSTALLSHYQLHWSHFILLTSDHSPFHSFPSDYSPYH